MEPRPEVSVPAAAGQGPAPFGAADAVRPRPRGALWHAAGTVLLPSLVGLVASALLAPVAPVLSLVLLVAAMLGAAGFLWIVEHDQAGRAGQLRPPS